MPYFIDENDRIYRLTRKPNAYWKKRLESLMGPPEQCKIVGYSIDEEVKSTCACGKTGIKYLFNVENAYGDVHILGSSCQNTVWSRNRPLRGINRMKAMVKILRKQRPCAFFDSLARRKTFTPKQQETIEKNWKNFRGH